MYLNHTLLTFIALFYYAGKKCKHWAANHYSCNAPTVSKAIAHCDLAAIEPQQCLFCWFWCILDDLISRGHGAVFRP